MYIHTHNHVREAIELRTISIIKFQLTSSHSGNRHLACFETINPGDDVKGPLMCKVANCILGQRAYISAQRQALRQAILGGKKGDLVSETSSTSYSDLYPTELSMQVGCELN